MSSRNIRKLFGTTTLPPLEGNSDEEFEPLYAKETNSKFSGLVLSSHSESEQEIPSESADEIVKTEEKKKKKKTKKGKRKAKPAGVTQNAKGDELDEIDKSVMEVNAILGKPPPASSYVPVEKKVDPMKLLLSVQAKHLDFNNELKRIFGSESLDDTRGKKCRPHNVIKYRRGVIVPIPENKHYVSVGLSMSLHRRENDPLSYFTFDHNREYQKMHQNFLILTGREDVMQMADTNRNIHIEGLLQSADYMFRSEEYTAANNILEEIISYLHYIAHPCFNLTDSIRLEYKYMENRPFHIAVLKYCHMLTNKACHRTALELAKLLLNLDPSDPLAIIFIIDTIALRAREHQWLIDTIDYWKKERDAGYLFNIQYSYAMAHFHVAKKNKSSDLSHADELVQTAMLHYPTVAARLFENCKQDCTTVCNHPYFNLSGEEKFPEKIKTAMILHTKLVCWRWREPDVMQWFLKNACELVQKLDNDPVIKMRGEELTKQRHALYAACPEQILRHLYVIRPMANLLVEWELPNMKREFSWDPLASEDSVNRYGYTAMTELQPSYYNGLFNIFARFMGPAQLYPEQYARHREPTDFDLRLLMLEGQAGPPYPDDSNTTVVPPPDTSELENNPTTPIPGETRTVDCSAPEFYTNQRDNTVHNTNQETEDTDSDSEEATNIIDMNRRFSRLLLQCAAISPTDALDPDDWDIHFNDEDEDEGSRQ